MFAVRKLRAEEVRLMVLAGQELHQQSAYAHMEYDCNRVANLAYAALQEPDRFFIEAVTHNDSPIGLLFAGLSESYFGTDKIAKDFVFFIVPQAQGMAGKALRELVENYRAWATERGAKLIQLGCTTQINADRTRDLFEHMGFPQTGSLHAVTVH